MPQHIGRRALLLQVLIHVGALLPLALLLLDFAFGRLTANPIREIQLRTGSHTMLLLTLSMACKPVYVLTGLRTALEFRRPLGLYAFLYAALHVFNLVVLDYLFNFRLLWEDIAEKPYILAGLPAFLMLLVLAITSIRALALRLGKKWRRVHRLAYAAAILAVVHYLWQVRVNIPAPYIYAVVLAILLVVRLPQFERFAAGRFPWRRADKRD